MSKKKTILLAVCAILVVLLNVVILTHKAPKDGPVELQMKVQSDLTDQIKVYFSPNEYYNEEMTDDYTYVNQYPNGTMDEEREVSFTIDSSAKKLRMDFGVQPGIFVIRDVKLKYRSTEMEIPLETLMQTENHDMVSMKIEKDANGNECLVMKTENTDPYLDMDLDQSVIHDSYAAHAAKMNWIKILTAVILLDGACLVLFRHKEKVLALPVELFQNRKLIFSLAKNDFKTKYAGSYLGIVWAFIQPIVTVLVYWFVFQVGLKSPGANGFPFVLWMIAGLVPWFFFSDVLNAGTNALLEYSYLVKKVVFKISILPMVKEISALFVHLFFVAFMVFLYSCYGYFPDLYFLQLLYYSFCVFVFSLGICYATCAIVIFFRDLSQIISIVLQVGVWVTPIMWNIDQVSMPSFLLKLLNLNPFYYIVQGYRDSLINKVWFFEHFDLTIYFWIVTLALFGIGTIIFKRLKVHFADVLQRKQEKRAGSF